MTDGTAWLVFDIAGEQLGLPAAAIDRVMPRPPVLRLPVLRLPAVGAGVRAMAGAVHIGNEIVPLLAGHEAADGPLIVLAFPAGRIAVGADALLGVGPLDGAGGWNGRPVRLLRPESFQQGARTRPDVPFVTQRSAPVRPVPPAVPMQARVLQLHSGGAAWVIAAEHVVSVHAPGVLTAVPLAPPALLGATVLRGQAVPVLTLARDRAAPAALVVVQAAGGMVAVAAEQMPEWTRAGPGTRYLPVEELIGEAGLGPLRNAPVVPVAGSAVICHLLPVMVGTARYCVRLNQVARVTAATKVMRLPTGGLRHDRLDGVVAVDGRVVPLTRARRWLGVTGDAPAGTHLVLHGADHMHVLAVDGVGRPHGIDAARIQPIDDPAGRLAAVAALPDGLAPVLDLDNLLARKVA